MTSRSPDSFDRVAELYDRARPRYPEEALGDLFALCNLQTGDCALEIGCGTGQLTLPLATRGLDVVALEPGPNLAAIARRRLQQFDGVEVVVNRFEDYVLPDERFDLIVSATAFHWVDPSVRVSKSISALRPGGHLCIIHTRWGVGPELDRFSAQSLRCYRKWDPQADPDFRPPTTGELTGERKELEDTPGLVDLHYQQYVQHNDYTTESYLGLLGTFSNIQGMDERSRSGLLDCLRRLIDADFGGELHLTDLREMWVATRL